MPRGRRIERKLIFDPVHGAIVLDGAALALIRSEAFQRLWGIRQTGFAHLVFPGANHTRLEHSLGVYSVASAMAERLGLAAPEAGLVASGALLHDLGHGPFSHTLESTMREALGHGHERESRSRILGVGDPGSDDATEVPRALERYGLDPGAVADLVDPEGRPERRPLLRAILHGAIDADRIDYLQRDAHYTGVAHGAIDAVRLLDTVRAYRRRLAFAEKGRSAVEGFLVGRSLMYSSVYYHKTVRSAEVMAQAAVERLPSYPASAVDLLRGRDAELLVALANAGGAPARLVRDLERRRLHKRAHGWTEMDRSARAGFRRLIRDPAARRAVEDEAAAAIGAAPGELLLDLSGLEGRTTPERDWDEVAILDGDRVSHPFRAPSVWQTLAMRSPTRAPVSVYAAPSIVETVRRRAERGRLLPIE